MANEEKDVCTKGKSCKTACIKTNLVCRESIRPLIQSGLSNLVNTLQKVLPISAPQRPVTVSSPASQTLSKGREFLRPFASRMDALDKKIGELRKANRSIEVRLAGRGKLSSNDRASLRDQLSKNLSELNKTNQQMVGVMNEIRFKMLSSSKMTPEQIRKVVENVDVLRAGKKSGADIRDQLAEFARMFGGKGFSNVKDTPIDVNPLTTIFFNKGRPWANVEDGHMQLDSTKGNTFHEMGHFVEHQRPWLKKYMGQWRDSRAWDKATVKEMYEGEDVPPPITSIRRIGGRQIPTISMSYLAGGKYREDEVGVADEFLSPYMGKIYPDGGTEVLSMSMEHFSSPHRMVALRRAHPELFDMVVGLSRD